MLVVPRPLGYWRLFSHWLPVYERTSTYMCVVCLSDCRYVHYMNLDIFFKTSWPIDFRLCTHYPLGRGQKFIDFQMTSLDSKSLRSQRSMCGGSLVGCPVHLRLIGWLVQVCWWFIDWRSTPLSNGLYIQIVDVHWLFYYTRLVVEIYIWWPDGSLVGSPIYLWLMEYTSSVLESNWLTV